MYHAHFSYNYDTISLLATNAINQNKCNQSGRGKFEGQTKCSSDNKIERNVKSYIPGMSIIKYSSFLMFHLRSEGL